MAFSSQTEALLDRAAQICAGRGSRLTGTRREELAHALAEAAERFGSAVGKATIQAEGQCASCQADTRGHA